jgi:predicted permease
VELDRRVLLFALGASALTGALAGGVPALMGSGRRADELRSGRRNVRATGPSSVLVVAQVALSAVLLVSSALLVRTLRAIGSTDLGFEPHATLEASVDPGAHGMDAQRRTALLDDLRRRAATIPGVNAAGLSWTPVLGQGQRSVLVRPPGAGPDGPATLTAQTNQVSPGFIAAIGAELIAGRDFTEGDIASAALRPTTAGVSGLAGVAILGESAARRLFADRPAVGRTVVVGQSERTLEVAGVIRDARLADLKEPNVALILEPFGQTGQPGRATLYVRGRTGSLPPLDALRSVLYDMDPTLPFYDMQPLSRRVAAAAVMERMLARLTTAFAVVALVLATVGLYGMMAMLVQGRRREMGVRLALGARPASVRGLVLGRGMRLAALGLGLGLVASTQTGRVLSARLWGVQPLDPVAFCAAAVVLGLAALVACWAPAVRATRVDPVDVLAAE